MRRLGHEVTGVDIEKYDGIADRVDLFVEADLDVGLPDEVGRDFDVILAADVFEHVRDPDRLLAQCSQRLRPGGTVIASVPNFAHWYPRLRVVSGRFDYDRRGILDRGHIRFFTKRSFERLATRSSLRVRRREAVGVPQEVMRRGGNETTTAGSVAQLIDRLSRASVAIWPSLFAYQFVVELERSR
jgi:SAM-dependent methyltransferase